MSGTTPWRVRLLPALALLLAIVPSPCSAQSIRALTGHHGAVTAVVFRSDGQWMASASFDHTLKVWDVGSGKALLTCKGHADKVTALAWSGDGRWLASAGLDHTVRVWNAATGKRRLRLATDELAIQALAFSGDGQRLFCAGESGTVEVWDLKRRRLVQDISASRSPLYALALSAKCLAVGGQDGIIRLFDALTGKPMGSLHGHHEAVYSLGFSPDGGRLLSGSGDCSVRCWQVSTGKQLACLDGHSDAVYQVAFTTDGRRLVSADIDGQVIVRDSNSGIALHSHRFPSKTLCAAITPDGRQVGTGTGQARCYLLELPRRIR